MIQADSAAGAGETGATTENDAAQTQTDQESLAAILEPHELAALKLEETNDEQEQKVEGEEQAGDGSGAEGDRASEDASAGESAGTEEDGDEDAEAKGEAAGAEDEDDPKKPNPFDDEKVKKRLSREAHKRDRLLKAAGISDEQIAEVHKAADPVVAGEALLAKLAARQPVQVRPTPADPLADVTDAAGLQDKAAFYKDLQRFATLNPDGATDVVVGTDAEGREILRDYSKQEIAKMKLEAEEALRDWIPERQKYLAEEQKADKWVREFTLPSMFEEGTEHNQKFKNLLKQFPEAVRVPEYKLTIAHIILGQEVEKLMLENARKAQAAGKDGTSGKSVKPEVAVFLNKHPAKAPGVAGVGGKGGDGAGKTAAKPQDVEKARQRVEQGGGEDAEIEFISALSASQQKQKGAALV